MHHCNTNVYHYNISSPQYTEWSH